MKLTDFLGALAEMHGLTIEEMRALQPTARRIGRTKQSEFYKGVGIAPSPEAAIKRKATKELPERKQRHSEAVKSGLANMPNKELWKQNISAGRLGFKASPETKALFSRQRKGTYTEETRRLISVNSWSRTPEGRRFHSENRLGKPRSDLTRQKIAAYAAARSPEHQAKLEAARPGRHFWTNGVDNTTAKTCPEGWWAGQTQARVQCPHCGMRGGNTGMKAKHFENCVLKNPHVVEQFEGAYQAGPTENSKGHSSWNETARCFGIHYKALARYREELREFVMGTKPKLTSG